MLGQFFRSSCFVQNGILLVVTVRARSVIMVVSALDKVCKPNWQLTGVVYVHR